MAEQRAVVRKLLDHLYLIDDAGEATCYLLCGTKQAMVIDTVNGREDLHAIVRTLTQLPLVVVNTHGHGDHVYGNVYFEEAWIHPEDLGLAREAFACALPVMARYGLAPCPWREMAVGQVFDLGGITLEVVSLKGHTAGSVGLLDREDRILFSGDGANTHLWMQLDHSLSIACLQETLLALKAAHADRFDRVLTGHAKDFAPASIVDQLLKACGELLKGQCENDAPYCWFGGECLQHPLGDVPGECIVYTKDKL